jgi:CheY-like chemotaxis protein/two-component sensor histidine kinase
MERQLERMVHLVDDLLDVSRISRGKFELRKQRIELAEVLNTAVETSRPLIEAGGHELTVVLPPQAVFIDADMTRLGQVFSNLLNNAAKYSERGGHIRLAAECHGSDVVVSVKDTGIGIPPEMLSRVFDMFMQVDRSLEKAQGGLGIGLSLVQRLVEMHGGSVQARSEGYGLGSEFVVRLTALPAVHESQPPADEGEAPPSSGHRRILVADDNPDSADTLSMLLTLTGNEVLTASDGLQAVDVAAAFRPDVILLDIGMPKLNGYESCRRIRQQPWGEQPVIIAITGWGQDDDKRRSQEAGFNYHIVKPIDPDALEKLLAGLQPVENTG